ncbi:hypothetical protein ALC53_02164 [Atta colombica]|uniref:Uncharacterized protein n=1 Tax=Atta colombica TaxID=520822 RepID=A0A195BS44_9HYME|nr:hypothetical protein ALC53_02164 [Atta colombica]
MSADFIKAGRPWTLDNRKIRWRQDANNNGKPTHGRNALVRKHSKLFGANPVHAHDQESPGRNPGVEEDNLDVSRVMASPQSTSWPLFPWVGSETTSMEALSAKLYSAFPSLDGCAGGAAATPRQCGMGVLHPPRLMSREFRGPGCLHRHRCYQHRGLADEGVRNVPARQAPDKQYFALIGLDHFDVFLTSMKEQKKFRNWRTDLGNRAPDGVTERRGWWPSIALPREMRHSKGATCWLKRMMWVKDGECAQTFRTRGAFQNLAKYNLENFNGEIKVTLSNRDVNCRRKQNKSPERSRKEKKGKKKEREKYLEREARTIDIGFNNPSSISDNTMHIYCASLIMQDLRQEWRRHIPWIASAGGILVALQSIAEKALPAVGGKKEESVIHFSEAFGLGAIFVRVQSQTVPTLKQMRQAGTFETRAAHNKSHHRCGCRPGSSGLPSAREAARRGAQRDRSEGPENRGPDPRRPRRLNCKNMVTIPGLKRNYTNEMENANKFSVPRQRIHILLTGRLQCEVAREVYALILTSTTVNFTSSRILGVRHESHMIGQCVEIYRYQDLTLIYLTLRNNIQIDNRGNAILHRMLIQACKRVDEPRVVLRRTITLRNQRSSRNQQATIWTPAFQKVKQVNISLLLALNCQNNIWEYLPLRTNITRNMKKN